MTIDAAVISDELARVADAFAESIPKIDAKAEHSRWKPGIGPFEEGEQIRRLVEASRRDSEFETSLDTEVTYPGSAKRCDLVLERPEIRIPVEVKLLRFRLDNGQIDPNCFSSVFSPFPEAQSASLLTDIRKLYHADFECPGGVMGIYYERNDEPYEELNIDRIADKFCMDVDYWYDLKVETSHIRKFSGLRHPHHERGAVVTWTILQ